MCYLVNKNWIVFKVNPHNLHRMCPIGYPTMRIMCVRVRISPDDHLLYRNPNSLIAQRETVSGSAGALHPSDFTVRDTLHKNNNGFGTHRLNSKRKARTTAFTPNLIKEQQEANIDHVLFVCSWAPAVDYLPPDESNEHVALSIVGLGLDTWDLIIRWSTAILFRVRTKGVSVSLCWREARDKIGCFYSSAKDRRRRNERADTTPCMRLERAANGLWWIFWCACGPLCWDSVCSFVARALLQCISSRLPWHEVWL